MLRCLLQSSLVPRLSRRRAAPFFGVRVSRRRRPLRCPGWSRCSRRRVADLVLLGGGFDAGLRQGMVCRVTRGATEIAEVLLVELRPTCSAALILNLAPKQSIHAGDLARIKVLKT